MIMLAGGFALGGPAQIATGADLFRLLAAIVLLWAAVVTMAFVWWHR